MKALCLGAKAVGLGRQFHYAQSVRTAPNNPITLLIIAQAYGAAGVVKSVRILEREIVSGMRLMGVRTVKELVPEMVRSSHS